MPVEAVDINTYLCIQMEGLERIAQILGRGRDAEMWHKKRHALVSRMIEHMYDPKEGLFWNHYDNKPVSDPDTVQSISIVDGCATF